MRLSLLKLPSLARRSLRGVSLIEVAVASAFLMVTSVGVFTTMSRMQQSAITNRALTNANNILRNVVEQALSRGWDNEANPLDILALTVGGNTDPYDSTPSVTDARWRRWDMYRGADAAAGTDPLVPIYEDVSDVTRNVPARLYRKVQRVAGSNRLLWLTFRIEYNIRGRLVAQEAWATRAAD